jgi:hypothetical protein
MEHVEAVGFFTTEFPNSGWQLETHTSWDPISNTGSSEDLKHDEMLFSNVDGGRYWLDVKIHSHIDMQGVQIDNPRVLLAICTEEELNNIDHAGKRSISP